MHFFFEWRPSMVFGVMSKVTTFSLVQKLSFSFYVITIAMALWNAKLATLRWIWGLRCHRKCVSDDRYWNLPLASPHLPLLPTGNDCIPRQLLPYHLMDNFEAGISQRTWASVTGGRLGIGCGALVPYGHGKSLYFSLCGVREAVTVELDTRRNR